MLLENVFNSSITEDLAWTMLNSIWQIVFVAFLLFILLRLLPKSNANARYITSLIALVLSLALPIATFFYLNQSAPETNQVIYPGSGAVSLKGTNTGIVLTKEITFNWINGIGESVKTNLPDYANFLAAFWLLGVLFFSLRYFGGYRKVSQFRKRGVSIPSTHWQERFSKLCDTMQMTKPVKLFQSEIVKTPMVIGFLKPMILIPTSIFLQMDAKQLETVIAHELVHIKRFDFLVNTVQNLVEIFFFYHPCVWWISSIIRHERECACDQTVIGSIQNANFTYAKALTTIAELRNESLQKRPKISIAATGGKLAGRIRRIIDSEEPILRSFERSLLSSALVFVFVVTCVCVVSLTLNKDRDVLTSTPSMESIPKPPGPPPAPPAPPKPPPAPPAPPKPPPAPPAPPKPLE